RGSARERREDRGGGVKGKAQLLAGAAVLGKQSAQASRAALLSARGSHPFAVVIASLQVVAHVALQCSTAALAATCNKATRGPAGGSSVLGGRPWAGGLLLGLRQPLQPTALDWSTAFPSPRDDAQL